MVTTPPNELTYSEKPVGHPHAAAFLEERIGEHLLWHRQHRPIAARKGTDIQPRNCDGEAVRSSNSPGQGYHVYPPHMLLADSHKAQAWETRAAVVEVRSLVAI